MVGGVGIGVKLYPRVLFRFFQLYGSFLICTAYHEKREFMLNAIKNVFWWWCGMWSVCPGGQILIPPLTPKNIFQRAE